MRLICFWCFLLAAAARAQQEFYGPQTFSQNMDSFHRGLFTPASGRDGTPQSISQSWNPSQGKQDSWRASPRLTDIGAGPGSGPVTFKPEPWRQGPLSKEQQAAIIHHKQALTSDGAFRFEYASDNGLVAGEQIEPDGSRVGAYQYKDPSGQLVKLKYRAGKEGFQILEGSHLPKSPEPEVPQSKDNHYQQAYVQQRQQYELQQQYNQQRPEPNQNWRDNEGQGEKAAGGQHYVQNWRPQAGAEDDGQYRENDVDKGPHSFGEGYAFAFKG